MRRNVAISFALLIAALVAAPSAVAQGESKGDGTVTYVPTRTEAVEQPDGTMLQHSVLRGVVLANDPSVPFHLSPQDCPGTNLIGADGTPIRGHGYCVGVDRDGDVWWIWWLLSPDKNTWGFLGGTGKYVGIEGGGTTETLAQTPDGTLVISWEGTWRM